VAGRAGRALGRGPQRMGFWPAGGAHFRLRDEADRFLVLHLYLPQYRRLLQEAGLPVEARPMCIHPNTPEYDRGMGELATLTRTVAAGAATAKTFLDRAEWFQLLSDIPRAVRDYDRAFERRGELTPAQLAFLHVKRGVC